MKNTPDMTAMLKDAMTAFPIDTASAEDAMKSTAELGEKISAVNLSVAEKATAISSKWSKDTVKGMKDFSKAKSDPTEYIQAATEFTADFGKSAQTHMAALGDLAKQAQVDMMDIFMSAGNQFISSLAAPATSAKSK